MPPCNRCHATGGDGSSARSLVWHLHPTLGAYVAQHIRADKGRTLLVWPLLQYNISGAVVRAVARRFDVANEHITILHDDLDVKVGSLKWKRNGSAGGNGVKSVIRSLGSDAFRRLRIGIGRPSSKDPAAVVPFVLGAVPKGDLVAILEACSREHIAEQLLDQSNVGMLPASVTTRMGPMKPTLPSAPAFPLGILWSMLTAYASTFRVALKWLIGAYRSKSAEAP